MRWHKCKDGLLWNPAALLTLKNDTSWLAASSASDVLTSSSKKRKADEAEPGEEPCQKREESRGDRPRKDSPPQDATSSDSKEASRKRQKGSNEKLAVAEQLADEDPVKVREMNVQLLELVHELEAHLMDDGKPVRQTKWSESIEATKQRLNRYKKKKEKIATLSQIEVRRKQAIPGGAALPTNTVSTFGHVISPSIWSQGVFSNLTAQGGAQGGQGPFPFWNRGEETPVSELKQLAQEGQKVQEGQAAPGRQEEKPASSGSGKMSKEKGEEEKPASSGSGNSGKERGEEVEGRMAGSAPQEHEALAKLVRNAWCFRIRTLIEEFSVDRTGIWKVESVSLMDGTFTDGWDSSWWPDFKWF
jgi:hypothetical protein